MKSPAVRESRTAAEFERRAARAELLSRQAPSCEGPLRFAAGLYRVQGPAAAAIEAANTDKPLSGHLDEDLARFFDQVSAILRYAAEEGPQALSEQARSRQEDLPPTTRARLQVYWAGDQSSTEDYLSRAVLRPYVEFLRSVSVAPDRVHRRGQCPFCGGAPWISARREGSLMEGARRMLGCALCGGEWLFGRILCASCFEENPHRLPTFQNEKHSTVRIEACETCHRYVKSIDMSLDARPIPEVDDLVSLSMDLWAAEQGYTRIEPGLAGI
ncbi:MAG TPA: formate dehydrogenase accessory protein FdhE [Candidatus Polarisedimenticolia bacterium]|nr:formate dehydrogenase accessory protein FdhE [Candidatus Polarisedimenticolia bacterium]